MQTACLDCGVPLEIMIGVMLEAESERRRLGMPTAGFLCDACEAVYLKNQDGGDA